MGERKDAAQKMRDIGNSTVDNNQSSSGLQNIVIMLEEKAYEEAIKCLLSRLIGQKDLNIICCNLSNEKEREANIVTALSLQMRTECNKTIICIADANNHPQKQKKVLLDLLKDHKFFIQEDTVETGIVAEKGGVKVGIWMMPNNKDKGTYADFYLTSAKIKPEISQYISDILEDMEKKGIVKYTHSQREAARFFTYLAWQPNPSRSNEQLYTAENFNFDTTLYKNFIKWLNSLIPVHEEA